MNASLFLCNTIKTFTNLIRTTEFYDGVYDINSIDKFNKKLRMDLPEDTYLYDNQGNKSTRRLYIWIKVDHPEISDLTETPYSYLKVVFRNRYLQNSVYTVSIESVSLDSGMSTYKSTLKLLTLSTDFFDSRPEYGNIEVEENNLVLKDKNCTFRDFCGYHSKFLKENKFRIEKFFNSMKSGKLEELIKKYMNPLFKRGDDIMLGIYSGHLIYSWIVLKNRFRDLEDFIASYSITTDSEYFKKYHSEIMWDESLQGSLAVLTFLSSRIPEVKEAARSRVLTRSSIDTIEKEFLSEGTKLLNDLMKKYKDTGLISQNSNYSLAAHFSRD